MKRFLQITAITLISLIVLLSGVTLFCIKSTFIHQTILSHINKLIPGTVSLDKLHIAVLSMRIEISNLSLSDSSGTKVAGIDQLIVDISPVALLRRALIVEQVVIDHPWGQLKLNQNGRLSLLSALTTGIPPPDSIAHKPVRRQKIPNHLQ